MILILRLSDTYTNNKAAFDFGKFNFLFCIGQLQGLSGIFLSNKSLGKPQPHSLFRQVRFYSSVFFSIMVDIVGIGLYGLLCCGFLVTDFLHLQMGEHLRPMSNSRPTTLLF